MQGPGIRIEVVVVRTEGGEREAAGKDVLQRSRFGSIE